MRSTYILLLNQHVEGFNAKSGHVVGLPSLTGIHGFLTNFSMRLSEHTGCTFKPAGVTVAVSSLNIRRGQPQHIWSPASVKGKGQSKAKFPSMPDHVQGDALMHFVLEITNDSMETVDANEVTDVLDRLRLSGGGLPNVVPGRGRRRIQVFDTYEPALDLIPSNAWLFEDACAAFATYLEEHPEHSSFSAFLAFTDNRRPKRSAAAGEDETMEKDVDVVELPVIEDETNEEDIESSWGDPDLAHLPHRLPVLIGWRLLSEPKTMPDICRIPGLPTARAEAVHGVVFLRKVGVVRYARHHALMDLPSPNGKPRVHFRPEWRSLSGREAVLLVGQAL